MTVHVGTDTGSRAVWAIPRSYTVKVDRPWFEQSRVLFFCAHVLGRWSQMNEDDGIRRSQLHHFLMFATELFRGSKSLTFRPWFHNSLNRGEVSA